MNQTAAAASNSASLLSTGTYGTLTAVHLIVIAVFALLVIAAIVYGARLKHSRTVADEQVEAHAVEAGQAPVEPDAPEPSLPADRREAPAPPVAEPAERPLADEPIAASAPLDAAPAVEAASPPAPSIVVGQGDEPVTLLKGLGPKVAARLAELGITSVGQIAALTDDKAERIDVQLGPFSGRMNRDRWVEQARFLAAGDRAGFEAVFGKYRMYIV